MTRDAGTSATPGDRLGFETLISDISARLIASSPDHVDREIERALEQVRTRFRADRCGLLRIQQDRRRAYVSHAAYAEGLEHIPSEINVVELFPEIYTKLVGRGEANRISRMGDLPRSPDRDTYFRMGIRSTLEIPLRIGGGVRYILVLNCLGEERDWPEDYIPRLRLLGEVFVNALERKRGEALLCESEERARLAAESAGAGLWSLDLATGRFWLTDAARDLFGYAPDAEVTLEGFLGRVHAEDLGRVRQALHDISQDGRQATVVYRVVLPGAGTRWIKSRGSLVRTMSGGRDRLTGLSIDFTERKQAEIELQDSLARMAAAADLARLGFYEVLWDKQRVVLEYGIRDLLGLAPEEEPRALECWLERVHPEDRERMLSVLPSLIEGGNGPVTAEFRYLHPEKGQLWFRHSAHALEREPGGKVVRSVGVIHDVTDQKRVEDELRQTLEEVRRLRDEYQRQNIVLREQISQEVGRRAILGESEPMLRVLETARRVAPTDAGVLITGETGTGKELLAEAIHQMSGRRGRPMVKVSCGALPATLIESELFGRERGAYTGAMTQQIGRFEQANGSTLFLDEIAELSIDTQPKLLRVLQEGQFERLGGRSTQKVDVRVIAATNRDLPSLVAQGRFRSDLFFRLSVFPIEVPPLRDRREDIPLLVWHFVRHFSQNMGKSIDTIPRRTMEQLQRHPWPGNVRELRNLIERSVILSDTRVLEVAFPSVAASEDSATTTLMEAERRHILQALERSGWRIRGPRGAAGQLGLKPSTLHSRLKKLGISRPKP